MARWLSEWEVIGVEESLAARNVDELKAMLVALGKRPVAKKVDLIAAILPHFEGDGLRALCARMTEAERLVVAEAVHGPSRCIDLQLLDAKYGRLTGECIPRDRHGHRSVKGLLALLFYRGSVMPEELRDRLAALGIIPEPPEPGIASTEDAPGEFIITQSIWDPERRESDLVEERLPVTVLETEGVARRDLLAVLRLVAGGEIKVSAKGRTPSPAVQRRVAEVLEGGDFYSTHEDDPGPIRGFAWPLLVQAGGLAKSTGGKLVLTTGGKKALTAKPEAALCAIWKRWLTSTLFDELRRIEAIRGQTGKGRRGLTALADRRTAIEDGLRGCPVGRWVDVDEFLRYLRAAECDLFVSRNPWDLYFGELRYGSLGYKGHGTFEILEGRYTFAVLFEYAATLGLIDVAYTDPYYARCDYEDVWGTDDLACLSRYDGLRSFRLNALGAYALDIASDYEPSEPKPRKDLNVLPNLEVVVTAEKPSPSDELVLDRYGERKSDRVWRLSREKFLRAISEGQSLKDIENFLGSRSAEPLPDPVVRLLAETTARGRAVTPVGPALLLECEDPIVAALIANDSRTGKHCLPCGDRHLAVPLGAEAKFRTALERLGYPLPPTA